MVVAVVVGVIVWPPGPPGAAGVPLGAGTAGAGSFPGAMGCADPVVAAAGVVVPPGSPVVVGGFARFVVAWDPGDGSAGAEEGLLKGAGSAT